MTMLEDLREVVRLADEATKGTWQWSESGNIVTDTPNEGCDEEIAAVYSEHDDDSEPANSAAIRTSVQFIRTHAEQIERDARDAEIGRYFVEYAEWIRDEDGTLMAIRMPGKPDLSCIAFRRDAIQAAMPKEGE